MRVISVAVAAILAWVAAGSARADERTDAAARVQAVAPFVEEETVAVARLNLTRISPESLDAIGRALAILPGRLPEKREDIAGMLRALSQVGCKEVYAVVSLNNPDRQWKDRLFLILPAPGEVAEKAVRDILQLSDNMAIERIAGAIVVRLTEWEHFGFQPVERPELKAAFAAAGDAMVQVALIPPPASRRAVEELAPQWPQELGGGPTSVLTRGVVWAALSIDLPPHVGARLTIQSENASAAEALRLKLAGLAKLAGQSKEVRAAVPNFDAVVAPIAPRVEGDRLVAHVDEKQSAVGKLLADVVARTMMDFQRTAARGQSIDNLKRLALGMLNYESRYKHFPLPATSGPDGKPLLSWRVQILPYLDEMKLYRQFHLSEPWDSPHNRALIDKMPATYRCPMSGSREKGRTNYLLPVGNGAVFSQGKTTQMKDITDGSSNTILVLEVDDDQAVIWTKPDDWVYDPKNLMKGIGKLYGDQFHAAFCDGSVHQLTVRINPTTFGHLIQRADGHAIDGEGY
jgi:hypothetical protein